MTPKNLLYFYNTLQNLNIEIWIDGGWGVDALLEKQTRTHDDLDIVIQEKDLLKLREYLTIQGFLEIKLEIARPFNFVLADEKANEIDVHAIVLDEKGNGIYGPKENGQMYPADSLKGIGKIEGYSVRCISVVYQLESHCDYEIREKDVEDVLALCKKFKLSLPIEYQKYVQ